MGFRRVQFTSVLAPEEARARLHEVVAAPTIDIFARRPEQSYRGRVGVEQFEIRRVLGIRNAFAPIIRGRISQADRGSQIDVQMTVYPAFMVLFVLLMCALLVSTSESKRETALLLALGVVITALGFMPEARRSERFLRELLESPR